MIKKCEDEKEIVKMLKTLSFVTLGPSLLALKPIYNSSSQTGVGVRLGIREVTEHIQYF